MFEKIIAGQYITTAKEPRDFVDNYLYNHNKQVDQIVKSIIQSLEALEFPKQTVICREFQYQKLHDACVMYGYEKTQALHRFMQKIELKLTGVLDLIHADLNMTAKDYSTGDFSVRIEIPKMKVLYKTF